ncbi:Threonine--tRNA ligase [Chlamydiales bacterium SCGC AG-110-M15]|nr:Threonine--tRNA ligase [Chlamydiales bacterium SCGC AG-110-M15]
MAKMIQIHLKDNPPVELPEGSLAKDLAEKFNLRGPNQALAAKINGKTYDMTHPLSDGDDVQLLNFEDPEGEYVFWHTSAHVLAQAVLRLWPDAQPTIGPPIEGGFYYDFANLHISDEDFAKIEAEMKKIIKENFKSKREVFADKESAISEFRDNKYKVSLIESFEDGGEITAYRQGEFFDLCRGPHLPNLGRIKAIKVLKTSGAYWKGNSKNEMLTRLYGVSFPDRLEMKAHLHRLAEAKKRDHKVIGPKLGLFSLKEEAPGLPFIHPNGMHVWNSLMDYWRELHRQENYLEIKTPMMMSQNLWERSGHWANYRDNMYTTSIEDRDFAIKPMNCPGGMLFYRNSVHSYREFPLRVAEIGHVHRAEASGAVSGLMRVRGFHQDDAHIFMEPHQIEEEVLNVLKLSDKIYKAFGLEYHLELSTRPEKDTIGSDEAWEVATEGLRAALVKMGAEFRINEGDGAFYGPKIDFHIRDAIGRTWQCGTIQLDMALPERFDLEYTASDGTKKRPVMLHRAIYGSIERFFGILIEHFAGKFPLWLSPRQIRIITVADRHVDHALVLGKKFEQSGLRYEIDDSHESVSKKVRNAQMDQCNYILTVGDKEVENQNANLRTRDNVVHGEVNVDEFISALSKEIDELELESPYKKVDTLARN